MYDVIIVGARCAGSPTARQLARAGLRVLMLDKVGFPSDSFRNHVILPPGTAKLHEWGLVEGLEATGCPAIAWVVSDFGDGPLRAPVEALAGLPAFYAPRRRVLDAFLVDAAVAAGAELREHTTVTELLWDEDRVVGVRGHTSTGVEFEERAAMVVGADGTHSFVAEAVQAPVYDERGVATFAYYSYFADLPLDHVEMVFRNQVLSLMFPTHDDLSCVAVQAPVAGYSAFRADIEGSFYEHLAPAIRAPVADAKRAERWIGTADLPNRFRTPYGPGWALVGDAGYVKDPVMAFGISDAFRDADLLATALIEGLGGARPLTEALADYHAARDEHARPDYEANWATATFQPPPPEMLAERSALRAAVGGGA